jgi:hypothetical protein
MDISPPPRKRFKNPLGDIAKAIDDVTQVQIIPLQKSSKCGNAQLPTDICDSDFTWKIYIDSQD